jgi:hypothetical protein
VQHGGSNSVSAFLDEAPVSQHFVIEHYTVSCELDPGATLADVQIGSTLEMDASAIPHQYFNDGNISFWRASVNTRIYAGPGGGIFFEAHSLGGNIRSCSRIQIWGYLAAPQ